MKRFRRITVICLSAIAVMVTANLVYMCELYSSIKDRTMQSVNECVQNADLAEMIGRLRKAFGVDDSFLRLEGIEIQGEKTSHGYSYTDVVGRLVDTFIRDFHDGLKEEPELMPDRKVLDSLFMSELNKCGLYPAQAYIAPYDDHVSGHNDMWRLDYSVSQKEKPVYSAFVSPLTGHILGQMAGILVTSAAILLLMGFLIWYLLAWVGKLRTIEQMKDDFTHNMTHELKTPVAVAYSAADSMLRYYDHNDEARNRRFLEIIIQRLSFLSGMIENILSVSMERFRAIRLHAESITLRPFVEDIAGMVILKAGKSVDIDIDIPCGLMVKADPLHFGNVISNLIDNAVKYSADTVRVSIIAGHGYISIADNGIGIDKKDLPYIFDKFYRVTRGDRYDAGGYGLGLFYVRQIATLAGWEIEVDSKPGCGSVFTIRFKDNEEI